jgi:Effector-associated domain 2
MDTPKTFASEVKRYLKKAGYNQNQLAVQLNTNEQELSRALNKVTLSDPQIRNLVKQLASWRAFSNRNQVEDLLMLADCPRFNDAEWEEAPLSGLSRVAVKEAERSAPVNSDELLPSKPASAIVPASLPNPPQGTTINMNSSHGGITGINVGKVNQTFNNYGNSSGASDFPRANSGDEAMQQQKRELTTLLESCPQFGAHASRWAILNKLPQRIRSQLPAPYAISNRMDIANIIDVCVNYSDGLKILLETVIYAEGEGACSQTLQDFGAHYGIL